MKSRFVLVCACALLSTVAACDTATTPAPTNTSASTPATDDTPAPAVASDAPGARTFEPCIDGTWIGSAISYGPFRDGQGPGGASPNADELREDVQIMRKHWRLIRVYGSRGITETLLGIIREEAPEMRVMLGAWIDAEEELAEDGSVVRTLDDIAAENAGEVNEAIRLANLYPDIVLAVNIGNETQVWWSGHRVRAEVLAGYLQQARAGVQQPVTTADDYNFWNKPESRAITAEVDFIVVHTYAMWNGAQLEDAIAWTEEQFDAVAALHPDRDLVIGEGGWATRMHDEGLQAELIKAPASNEYQQRFYEAFLPWAIERRITHFSFEAFDENWKGGPHPNEVEKHWGVYEEDRTPKPAVAVFGDPNGVECR